MGLFSRVARSSSSCGNSDGERRGKIVSMSTLSTFLWVLILAQFTLGLIGRGPADHADDGSARRTRSSLDAHGSNQLPTPVQVRLQGAFTQGRWRTLCHPRDGLRDEGAREDGRRPRAGFGTCDSTPQIRLLARHWIAHQPQSFYSRTFSFPGSLRGLVAD